MTVESDVFDASVRLRELVREKCPGGCRLTSMGAACPCPTCDIDRLCREIGNLRKRIAADAEQNRSLAATALSALARAGVATPAEGYGTSIDWVLRDCIATIRQMPAAR